MRCVFKAAVTCMVISLAAIFLVITSTTTACMADDRKFCCTGTKAALSIDAKINGAFIVMGLLYGQGDMDKTIIIAMRCGQDSDCNPSNAGGILGTTIGRANIPTQFTSAIDSEDVFSHTAYNFPGLVAVSEKLARQAVVREGGRIEKNAAGEEVLVIRVTKPKPTKLEQCWEPGPIANSVYSAAEQKQIVTPAETQK